MQKIRSYRYLRIFIAASTKVEFRNEAHPFVVTTRLIIFIKTSAVMDSHKEILGTALYELMIQFYHL